MGACTICGQKAGLFSSVHPQCEEARVAALKSIREAARDALVGEESALGQLAYRQLSEERRRAMSPEEAIKVEKAEAGIAEAVEKGRVVLDQLLGKPNRDSPRKSSARLEGFWERCADLMKQGHLSRGLPACRDAVIAGWLDAAEAFLSARIATKFGVTDSVPAAMKAGDKEFGLGDSEERLTEARTLLRLSRMRSQIMSREPIERVPFDVIPARGEGIFWTFSPSTYCRQVSISTHGGGFGGVSVRVAPGVYVRSGGYQGESQPTHRLEPIASGTVAMSNLQTWFKSDEGITRITHESLISSEAFTDGFSLTPSTGSPAIFSLPVSERFPCILGGLLVALAKDLAVIVKNKAVPVNFA